MRHSTVCCLLLGAMTAGTVSAGQYDHQVPMQDKGASTMYVEGKLEGFGPIEMMVDTGSSYTTINEVTLDVLTQGGHAEYVKDLAGVMADGSRKVVPVYRLTALSIGGGCTIKDVEAAVFPGNTRLILGLSALRKTAPFVFSMEPPALVLSNCAQGETAASVQTQRAAGDALPAVPLPPPAFLASE